MTPAFDAFAGVDGGASRTRARAVTADGRIIGEGRAGPSSLTLSPKAAAENCRQAIAEALAGSGFVLASCGIVCGVAGHRQTEQRRTFEHGLADAGSLEVISDGYAALLGAHNGAKGAVVVTGTGSVGLSLNGRGELRQFGGFGPVVGDEGGGNWLGRQAVRSALRAMDDEAAGNGKASQLAVSLTSLMGRSHEAILDWIRHADATRFADLVPLILQHDADGDALASRLLDDAAEDAARLIVLAGDKGKLNVAWLGGLAETLSARLPASLRASLTRPVADAADGALLRAFEKAPPETYRSSP